MGVHDVWHIHPDLLNSRFAKYEDQVDKVLSRLRENGIWNSTWNSSYWMPGVDCDTTFSFLAEVSMTVKQVCGGLPNMIYRGFASTEAEFPDFFFAHEDAKDQVQVSSRSGSSAGTNDRPVPNWSYYRALGEHKKTATGDVLGKAWQHETRKLKELFKVNPIRLFANGMTIAGENLRFWHMDHAGSLVSSAYDLSTEAGARALILMLIGFLSADTAADLGLDPTIEIQQFDENANEKPEQLLAILKLMNTQDTKKSQLVIKCRRPDKDEMSFILESVRYHEPEVPGRGTVVFLCKSTASDSDSSTMTVKRIFQHHEKDNEGVYIKQACDANVGHVAQYFHHEVITVNGVAITHEQYTRKDLDMRTQEGQAIGEFCSYASDDAAQHAPEENQKFQQVWTTDLAYPIYEEQHLPTLLQGFHDVVLAHQELVGLGILHREIAIDSLMMRFTPNGGREMFISDFRCAISISVLESTESVPIAGTVGFLAADLVGCRTEKQTFRHDLESIFWVLLCLFFGYRDGQRIRNGPFKRPNHDRLYLDKLGWLNSLRSRDNVLTSTYYRLGQLLDYVRAAVKRICKEEMSMSDSYTLLALCFKVEKERLLLEDAHKRSLALIAEDVFPLISKS